MLHCLNKNKLNNNKKKSCDNRDNKLKDIVRSTGEYYRLNLNGESQQQNNSNNNIM